MGTGEQKWRLPITCGLTALGVIILLTGLLFLLIEGPAYQYVITAVAGLALIIYFGPLAAGARKSKIGTSLVKAETEYSAPPPPHQQRSYLPKDRGSSSKEK